MNILVTGPHRSGTTFGAKVLAHETGFNLAYEEKIHFADRYLLECHLNDAQDWVIQCPFLAHVIHEYDREDTLVVWMKRPLDEILKSQQRMYGHLGYQLSWWDIEQAERRKYHTNEPKPISQIKNECWEIQKTRVDWMEVEYHSLKAHPLYHEQRANFSHRQTEGQGIEKKPYRPAWNEGVVVI